MAITLQESKPARFGTLCSLYFSQGVPWAFIAVAFVAYLVGHDTYDIHRLVEDRDLIIGGVKLHHPDNLGLDGHSDADVLSHSIMDALLGALSLGDIGKFFPPNEEKWKNADSLFLLSKVIELIRKEGWEVNNIDSVIVAERPKIKPHVEAMKKNISGILHIDENLIGIKATTNEKFEENIWEFNITAKRIIAWLSNHQLTYEDSNEEYRLFFNHMLQKQTNHLLNEIKNLSEIEEKQ